MNKSILRLSTLLALLVPALSAHSAAIKVNEQFDAWGSHFNINFIADNSAPSVVTNLSGNINGHAVAPAPLGLFGWSDNKFNVASVSYGGWNYNGLGLTDTFTGTQYNPYNSGTNMYVAIASNIVGQIAQNYTYSVSPVPVPAAVWLFGSAVAGLLASKRKKTA